LNGFGIKGARNPCFSATTMNLKKECLSFSARRHIPSSSRTGRWRPRGRSDRAYRHDGFEILVLRSFAEHLWNDLNRMSAEFG
jgi:hypothetical protein